jgi:hypothetical protein
MDMMDFLKQSGDNLDKLDSPTPGDHDAELGSDNSFVTTTSREKSIKNGTIIFAVVFCASLVCLWFMIKKTTPQAAMAKAASEDSMQIENAIAKITGTKAEFFNGIDNVVGKFHEFSSVLQVRVNELQKNPFEHQNYSDASITTEQDQAESATERERAAKFTLEKEAGGMQLLSIMSESNGYSCMINDKMLKKGDMIDGWRVVSITAKSVELSAQGMQKVLKISSED